MCQPPAKTSKVLPVFTKAQVEERVMNGEVLLIYKDKVYNVSKFAKSHPGGELLIRHMAGRVSSAFTLTNAGKDATDAILAYHPDHVLDKIKYYLEGELQEKDWNKSQISHEWKNLLQELKDNGLFTPKLAFWEREVVKFAILWAATIGLAVYSGDNWSLHLFGALVAGIMWHQASFVGHDSGHSAVTHDCQKDQLFGVFIANFLGGLSIGWWKDNHNVHHIVTNDPEHDPDIQHLPFFAVSSKFFQNLYSSYYKRTMKMDAAARVFVSMQHYLFYIVMMFGRFNLYANSFAFLAKNPKAKYRNLEIIGICFFWSWYTWTLSHLPSLPLVLMYVFVSHATTFLLHVQITISHFGMSTEVVKDEEFATLAMRTTMDVECPTWLDWFHGGLQFQVAHHMFPRLPRHNLRKAREFVREFAAKTGLTYHSYGFVKSNRVVLGALKQVADQVKFLAKVANHEVSEAIKSQ